MANYPRLFEPGLIGSLKLKNRIIMAPMATNFATAGGEVSALMLEYYGQRARGGAGMITIENANVSFPEGKSGAVQVRIDEDIFIPGLSRLARRIREEGSLACIQINHAGGPARVSIGQSPVAPSAIPYGTKGIIPQELSLVQIQDLAKKFAQAALRAKRAGFHAVEIHAAHAYLIAAFLSPYMNRRNDEYGGTLKNRSLFLKEIISSTREQVGSNYPVIVRISGSEFLPGGREIGESIELAKYLEDWGVDAIHVSAGVHLHLDRARIAQVETMGYPQGWKTYLAKAIKEGVKIPVITVGVIREPKVAEEILARQEADFVAHGRTLIADPFWPIKAEKGEVGLIRRCISCREGCVAQRSFYDRPITCAINPSVGQEDFPSFVPALKKRVVVIGGGPSGMQFALTARERGNQVDLYEKDDTLGGQLKLASLPPKRGKIRWVIEDFEAQLRALGVRIHLGKEITEEDLAKWESDILVIAVGSTPFTPNELKGISDVVDAREVLRTENRKTDGTVIVVGGGSVGCEVALWVKKASNKVMIVEQRETLANDTEPLTREELLLDLKESGILVQTGAKVVGVEDHRIQLIKDGKLTPIDFDLLITALGSKSVVDYKPEVFSKFSRVFVVGDAAKPGNMMEAIHQARSVALQIL